MSKKPKGSPPERAARAETHESRFRPKKVAESTWRRRIATAINRHNPAARA